MLQYVCNLADLQGTCAVVCMYVYVCSPLFAGVCLSCCAAVLLYLIIVRNLCTSVCLRVCVDTIIQKANLELNCREDDMHFLKMEVCFEAHDKLHYQTVGLDKTPSLRVYVFVYMCVLCVLQIAELKRAIAVGRKKVKERRAVEEQLVQKQIEVHTYLTTWRRGERSMCYFACSTISQKSFVYYIQASTHSMPRTIYVL